jgi:hypothetical protein
MPDFWIRANRSRPGQHTVHSITKDLDVKTMKRVLFLSVLIAGVLPVLGELSDRELKQFKSDLEIGSIRDETRRNEEREKYEVLAINTFQSDGDPDNYDMSRFRMRIVAELTDKQKNTYLVKFTGNASEERDSEYLGEDYWNLYMAHGDLERPKISGYIVQYGIMDGEAFVVLAQEENNAEEILERVREGKTVLFQGKVYLRHYYLYNDRTFGGGAESTPVNIRQIKE